VSNELFLAASEVNLCIAGNQIEKALISACTGLKRFLDDPQQSYTPGATTAADKLAADKLAADQFANALEDGLTAAKLDSLGARLLIAELRLVLATPKARKEALDAEGREKAQLETFRKARELQAWVCSLPEFLEDKQKLKRAQPNVTRGLTYVGVALAAAGTVGYAATPAGILALGGAGIAEVVKLIAGYVFGKSVEQAHEKFNRVVHDVHGPERDQEATRSKGTDPAALQDLVEKLYDEVALLRKELKQRGSSDSE